MNKKQELSLGDRMKDYEANYEVKISPDEHMIIRIDGHHFSKFTKKFNKPFDEVFSRTMIETTKDLVTRFRAYTAYTQSDEISLVLMSLKDTTNYNVPRTHKPNLKVKSGWTHINSGRVQKVASLASAYATMRFNYHFDKISTDWEFDKRRVLFGTNDKETEILNSLSLEYNSKKGTAWFDARVFGVPSDEEAFNAILWRIRDCEKNSKSMHAQAYCSHKELQNKNGQEQIEYCKEKTGMDWNEIDENLKYGTIIKKEHYLKETEHGKVQRSRVKEFILKPQFSEENVKFITLKYVEGSKNEK